MIYGKESSKRCGKKNPHPRKRLRRTSFFQLLWLKMKNMKKRLIKQLRQQSILLQRR